jgi:hypothetical protein
MLVGSIAVGSYGVYEFAQGMKVNKDGEIDKKRMTAGVFMAVGGFTAAVLTARAASSGAVKI